MFQIGQKLIYGIHGVCEVASIEAKRIVGKESQYYVLKPLAQPDTVFYVPTQNEAALSKLHPLLTQTELTDMLHSADVRGAAWIEDERERKQLYCNLITSADRAALVRMVHAIHKHKQQLDENGRRLHLCDENFLRDAQKLLGSEFSQILNIRQEDVGNYIQSILNAESGPWDHNL